ncbi:MAG: nuclear transport factor 2 family protein [Gemmatimonadota bacterium]
MDSLEQEVRNRIDPTSPQSRLTERASLDAHLRRLNQQYVSASLAGDVEWYRSHLADEFICIESDGTVLDKAAFLRMTAEGSDLRDYRLDEVDVRFYGDVALVRAAGSWIAKNGTPGLSRYVDIYVRTGETWKVVSAQITRPRQRI